MFKFKKAGFTLIELLIVMAILGVLAAVVLIAINPAQQLARTRDAGRKSDITQIGRTLQSYFTTRGKYLTAVDCPGVTTGWLDCLVGTGELREAPSEIVPNFGNDCSGGIHPPGTVAGVQNRWCYGTTTAGDIAVAYATLESNSEASKCDTAGEIPYIVWSSADGRSCLRCIAAGDGRPEPGVQPCNSKQ